MAIDYAAVTEAEWDLKIDPGAPESATYSALVIYEETGYSALCRELDIAACGDTAAEAFFVLKAAVREALAVAAERNKEAGQPVSDSDLAEFLSRHRVDQPMSSFTFAA
jgi:hypothetical protein